MLSAAEINQTTKSADSSRYRPKKRPSLHLQSSKVLPCRSKSSESARSAEQLLKTATLWKRKKTASHQTMLNWMLR